MKAKQVRKEPPLGETPTAADGEDDRSAADTVVDHICQGVLDGRLVPGQRLVESDLTRTLKVSRGPVREAFRRLEALGVITQNRHRGACVRTLEQKEATDLLQAVEPLAGLIAALAAAQVAQLTSATARTRTEKALKPYLEGVEDTTNLLGQRRHFYDALMHVGGNSQLPSLLPTMRIHLLRLQVQSFLAVDDRQRHLRDYADITQAVLAGDVKKAERLMCRHLKHMVAAVAQLPPAAFPTPRPGL